MVPAPAPASAPASAPAPPAPPPAPADFTIASLNDVAMDAAGRLCGKIHASSPMTNRILISYPQVSRSLHDVRVPSLQTVFHPNHNVHDMIMWSLAEKDNASVKLVAASRPGVHSKGQFCVGPNDYVWTVELSGHDMCANIVLPCEFFWFDAKQHLARANDLLEVMEHLKKTSLPADSVVPREPAFSGYSRCTVTLTSKGGDGALAQREVHDVALPLSENAPSIGALATKIVQPVPPINCGRIEVQDQGVLLEELTARLRSVQRGVTVVSVELLDPDYKRVMDYADRLKTATDERTHFFAPGLFALPYSGESALFAQEEAGGRMRLLTVPELLATSSVENDVLVVRAVLPLQVDERNTVDADSVLPLFWMRYRKGADDELPAQLNYSSLSRFAVDRVLPRVPARPFWGGTWELEDVASHFASQLIEVQRDQFGSMGCVLRFPEPSAGQYYYVPYFFPRPLQDADGRDLPGLPQFQKHLDDLTRCSSEEAQEHARKLLASWRDEIYVYEKAREAALQYQTTLDCCELCLVCVSASGPPERGDSIAIPKSRIRFHWFAFFGCIEPNTRDPHQYRQGNVSDKQLKKDQHRAEQLEKGIGPKDSKGKLKLCWSDGPVDAPQRLYIARRDEDREHAQREAHERRMRECTVREAQQAKANADYADMERALKERQAKIAAQQSRKRREREEARAVA